MVELQQELNAALKELRGAPRHCTYMCIKDEEYREARAKVINLVTELYPVDSLLDYLYHHKLHEVPNIVSKLNNLARVLEKLRDERLRKTTRRHRVTE